MKLMVAFSSPKRSAKTVALAAQYAQGLGAELILCRVVPDAQKVGVIAQLIATERPAEKAHEQIEMVVGQLKQQGIKAAGYVRKGEVAQGIIQAGEEFGVSMIFVGTASFTPKPRFFMAKDPIVHYLVDHCPISLVLVRADETVEQLEAEDAADDAADAAMDVALDEAEASATHPDDKAQ
jgi:nucleotide-binding universal stress UspA family protein